MLKDNAASVNELNFTSTKAVVNPSWMDCAWVCCPKRPMKNSSENEKTKIAQKFVR